MAGRNSDKESASSKVARNAVAQQAKGVAKNLHDQKRAPAKTKAHKTPAVPAVPAMVQADSPPRSPRYAPSMQTPRASAAFVASLADLVVVDGEEIQDLKARVTALTARVARLEQARPPEQVRPPEQLRGGILQRHPQ